jgi:hypothetical protein
MPSNTEEEKAQITEEWFNGINILENKFYS